MAQMGDHDLSIGDRRSTFHPARRQCSFEAQAVASQLAATALLLAGESNGASLIGAMRRLWGQASYRPHSGAWRTGIDLA
jgi:hypothetical protein